MQLQLCTFEVYRNSEKIEAEFTPKIIHILWCEKFKAKVFSVEKIP